MVVRGRVGVSAAVVLSLLGLGGSARAHGIARLAPSLGSHADPRWIDRLPEMPAPRASSSGEALSGSARAAATPLSVLAVLPGLWCGTSRSSDDTTNEVANGAHSYHAIYALPANASDRFSVIAATLQADAFQASALLERLYGRSIRFDMGTSCGAQFLDISVVRLPETTEALSALAAADSIALLQQLSDDLAAAGFDPLPIDSTSSIAETKGKNYLVWMEGMSAGPGVCGVATQYDDTRRDFSNFNNYGGKLALVLRDGAGFCNSGTVRHEIGHNLGALQSTAPSAFDGAHCNDAYEDTMCYPQSPRRGSGGYQNEYFDYANDDYWDPPGGALPAWTVNLSAFLCPNIVCNVPSDPTLIGNLTGTLVGTLGDTIQGLIVSCPLGQILGPAFSCKANTGSSGSEVVRRATPRPRIVFSTRRLGQGRWRITAHLRGDRRALLTVRCQRRGRQVRVLQRRISARRTLRTTVRCDGRPRASGQLT